MKKKKKKKKSITRAAQKCNGRSVAGFVVSIRPRLGLLYPINLNAKLVNCETSHSSLSE